MRRAVKTVQVHAWVGTLTVEMCILQVLLLLPSQQGGYVIISVTLFVSSITQQQLDPFSQNTEKMQHMGQGRKHLGLHREQKTAPGGHFYFCWSILTIFTPLHQKMSSTHIWNKIYHLTLAASPHYRVKYEQEQFCRNSHFLLTSRNEKDVTVIWFGFC